MEGLKTKVLPTPMAKGMNQPKTRAGKLKGATPQNTPRGDLTTRPLMLPAMWSSVFALDQGGDGQGGLDDLDHPLHLAPGFADVLGLVDGNGLGQILFLVDHGLPDGVQITHSLVESEIFPGIKGPVA